MARRTASLTPPPITPEALVALRRRLGLNQQQFWRRFGVTQSGGCRYEKGRPMPLPVRTLVTLAIAPEKEAQRALAALRALTQEPDT